MTKAILLSDRRRPTVGAAIILVVLVMILTQAAGFLFTAQQQRALIVLRWETREMRIAQQALVDATDAVKDYAGSGDAGYLDAFYGAAGILRARREGTLRDLDAVTARAAYARGQRPALMALDQLDGNWRRAIELGRGGRLEAARDMLAQVGMRRRMAEVRDAVARYLDEKNALGSAYEARIALGGRIVLILQMLGGVLTVAGLVLAFRRSAVEAEGRREAVTEAVAAREQIEHLFRMTDMLQSATSHDDANAVLRATADRLLPDFAGALYVFNNSRDRLDLATAWNHPGALPADTILPSGCWALKRGKAHINTPETGALHCAHHVDGDGCALEMPMIARGEVHGLLRISCVRPDAQLRLETRGVIIAALADAMSLTLSNIALREKLRNQALRDPLTGLYNRRYMEDMLDRFAHLSERGQRPLAIIMIDLDHFKRLNDAHGHAVGDTVLRAAAATLAGGLRQSDVACRYGGEELTVLLPECGLADAVVRAETLRARIEALSDTHGFRITASFGVAAYPDAATKVDGLMRLADAALYSAKKAGRNCVVAAPALEGPELALAAE